MNNINFSFQKYRAIDSADIKLNGITVLAGENGCGKSTLTRSLFYMIDAITNYDEYVVKDFRRKIKRLSRKFDLIRRDIAMFSRESDLQSVQRIQSKFSSEEYGALEADEIMILFQELIFSWASVLDDYISSHANRRRSGRLMIFLNMDDNAEFDSNVFVHSNLEKARSFYDEYCQKLESRTIESMSEILSMIYNTNLGIDKFQIVENGVKMLNKKQFGHLFNIQRAIYVDTPMALAKDVMDNPLWSHFNSMMDEKCSREIGIAEKRLRMRLQLIMHGSVKMKRELVTEELHYVREDDLDIPIDQAATGLKTFAYIMRLLDNGLLDDTTLLIIDEPEAHLHPQWIVEFARILVQLNKELGVRIVIASHNPDMVAAIQTISRKEKSIENLTYYMAKKVSDYKYSYQCLGSNITEIFKSFNVAMERIEFYGSGED